MKRVHEMLRDAGVEEMQPVPKDERVSLRDEAERIVDEYRWDDGSHSEKEDAAYRQQMIDAIYAAIRVACERQRQIHLSSFQCFGDKCCLPVYYIRDQIQHTILACDQEDSNTVQKKPT